MDGLKQKLSNIFFAFQEGIYAVRNVYSEKGLSILRFPLLMIIVGPLVVWVLLYKPAANSYVRKSKIISSLKAQKAYGADFSNIRNTVIEKENILFGESNKSGWLSGIIRKVCSEENVVVRSMSEQRESALGQHYIKAYIDFGFYGSFEQAVKVITELENNKYFINIGQIEISKAPGKDDLGRVSVAITAETVLAKGK